MGMFLHHHIMEQKRRDAEEAVKVETPIEEKVAAPTEEKPKRRTRVKKENEE